MNKFISIIGLFSFLLATTASAYSPDLHLLGEMDNGKSYIDLKAIKNIKNGYVQVVVYEKYQSSVWIDNHQYLSSIRTYVLNCKNREIAEKSGSFYSGITSNSELIAGYNLINSRNPETGVTTASIDNLEFLPLYKASEDFDGSVRLYYKKIFKYGCH